MHEVVDTFQLADSVVYVCSSLWRILTVYEVIVEPPLDGAVQLIVTLTFLFTIVVGAAGTLGIVAALIDTSDESWPKPTKVRAVTLKV